MLRFGLSTGCVVRSQATLPRRTTTNTGMIPGIAALLIVSLTLPAQAQSTGRITGVVTDSASDRPVGDVSILVVGTRIGVMTDAQGRYTITGAPAGSRVIEARRIGYRVARIPNVSVQNDCDGDGEHSRRRHSPHAAGGGDDRRRGSDVRHARAVHRRTRGAEHIPVPATNAIESIQGKIAGVTVVPPGQPGSGTNILLRSPTSINKSNSPLVVVDGVIQSQAFGASSADLESMDIESMEVVKGAAAASLYGSRAAVRRHPDPHAAAAATSARAATRFTARSEWGNNELAGKIDWARTHYYQTNANGEYVNAAGAVVPRARRVARSPRTSASRTSPTAIRSTTRSTASSIRASSARTRSTSRRTPGRTNWFLSLVNSREDGVVLNSGEYNQNDVRLNLDHIARSRTSASRSAAITAGRTGNELYGDTFFDLINQAPDVDLRARIPTARRTSSSAIPRAARRTRSTCSRRKTAGASARARRAASRRASRHSAG